MKAHGPAAAARKPRGLRGIHVFLIIAGFFAIDFAINGLFIARAVGTFPGEDVKNSYVQGNDYNATLALRARQLQLGWKAEAGLQSSGPDRTFAFRLRQADGKPVSGLQVELRWRWIGKDVDERVVELSEHAPGEYSAALGALGFGRIATTVDVRKAAGANPSFTASKTLVIE